MYAPRLLQSPADSEDGVYHCRGSNFRCDFTGRLPLPVVVCRLGGVWKITVAGASGGSTLGIDTTGISASSGYAAGQHRSRRDNNGGPGAVVSAYFTLADGAALSLCVGGKAGSGSGAGGGASFVCAAVGYDEGGGGVPAVHLPRLRAP